MRNSLLLGAALLVTSLCAGEDKAAPKSGLQPGKGLIPFDVLDVTGPNKEKQLCYV